MTTSCKNRFFRRQKTYYAMEVVIRWVNKLLVMTRWNRTALWHFCHCRRATSSPGSSRFPIWRRLERCINATLMDERVRLNYRIFFNYNEQQFITRMGDAWAPEHLILQNQFQKQFPAPNWLKNSGEVALHMLT